MRITILHSTIVDPTALDEQETLEQVAVIEKTLTESGHEVRRLAFNTDRHLFTQAIKAQQPELTFNVVESVQGRSDQLHLPALFLEDLNIAYTGNNATTLRLSTDKIKTKKHLCKMLIATPCWWQEHELSTVIWAESPFIIKSLLEDGSLGIEQTSIVQDENSLQMTLADRKKRFGGKWFIEKYIPGREFNISILQTASGYQILPIAEISFQNLATNLFPIVDYAGKWHPESESYQGSSRHFHLAPVDTALLQTLERICLQCAQIFNISGYARVDVRVDENNQPWVLEINANPSLAPDAGFPQAALQAGLSYSGLLDHLMMQGLMFGRNKVESICNNE